MTFISLLRLLNQTPKQFFVQPHLRVNYIVRSLSKLKRFHKKFLQMLVPYLADAFILQGYQHGLSRDLSQCKA